MRVRNLRNQWQAFLVVAITVMRVPIAAGFPGSWASALSPCIRGAASRRRGSATLESSRTALSGSSPPYIAVLTEPDACASAERSADTLRAIERATRGGDVDLVVVRVAAGPEDACRKWSLLESLAAMKRTRRFTLVVNDDVEMVVKALSQRIAVDGVHVKEYKSHLIPSIRQQLERAATGAVGDDHNSPQTNVIIGTSCHSLMSAKSSYRLSPRGPDYLFVGTCYLTQSHPEKQAPEQLEGPTLPGRIRRELHQIYENEDRTSSEGENNARQTSASLPLPTQRISTLSRPPVIYAIGGIDERNCHEPVVRFGADGAATIRAVMQASDPGETARRMKAMMQPQKHD